MPDDLRRVDFLRTHQDLNRLWESWRESVAAHNPTEEFQSCRHLMEVLSRETRTWVFSRLAGSGELPKKLVTPKADSAWGRDLNFLEQLNDHRFLSGLAASRPDAKDEFVPLTSLLKLFESHDEDSDPTGETLKVAFSQLARDSEETWLSTLVLFVRFRNKESHQTNQLDSAGAPIVITKRIKLFAPLIAEAMGQRIPWMVSQAANEFGSYKLRSKADIAADNHYALHSLRVKQGFDSNSAHHWYVRCDDNRKPVELFARLETVDQITAAVQGHADGTESVLFNSAKNGCLLPLIGPAFGLPDKPDGPGATQIIDRARDVVADERFKKLKKFLTRVVSDRLKLDIPDLDSPSRQPRNARASLVGELALLASEASMSFGRSLSTSGSPITGRSETLDQAEVGALSKRIQEVSDEVGELSAKIPDAGRTDLGVDAIVEFLGGLDLEVRKGRLSWASLVRLDDLVWHALRWDAPLYPDSEALDLQLWVGTPRPESSRRATYDRAPASGGAALLIEPPGLVEYLEGWSHRTERMIRSALADARSHGWQDPYELIAKAMAMCLKMRQGASLDSGKAENKKNVFVVDATLDRRMCRALEDEGAPSAVVYPIAIVDEYGGKYPAWAIRRFSTPKNKAIGEYSILWDRCGRVIDYQDIPRVVIVKPFGAPLERIDELAEATSRARAELGDQAEVPFPVSEELSKNITIERRYLFDDVSILKDLISEQDSMPPGFRTAIHSTYAGTRPFDLYFLGYALDEYGRRARMVADVRPPADPSGAGPANGRERKSNARYLSQPPPSGLVCLYLERAGIKQYNLPLQAAMDDLAVKLAHYERGGAKQ